MAKSNLEKYIKTEIENYGSPVDNKMLWQNVQADLKKKKKRRFLWIIFFGTLMFGVIGILGINMLTNHNDVKTESTIELREINDESIASNQEKSMPQKEIENQKYISSNAFSKQKKKENKLKVIEDVNLNKIEVKESDIIQSAENQNEKNNQDKKSRISHENTMDINSELNPTSNKLSYKSKRLFLFTSPLTLQHKNIVFNRKPFLINQNIIPVTTKKRGVTNNDDLKKIALGLHFKYGQIKKELESNLSSMDDYIAERKSLETPLDIFGASVDLQMDLTDKFYFQTGLNFYQIYERFDQTLIDDLLINVDNQLLIIYFDPDGATTSTFGEGEAISRTTITQNFYNKFRSIDIPLSFGYRVLSKNLYWNVDLGISLNIWSKGNGQTLNTGKENLNLDSRRHYKRQTGLNGITATALGYHFTDALSIEFRPEIRYQFSSSSTNESGYKHKYDSVSLGIGLRCKI